VAQPPVRYGEREPLVYPQVCKSFALNANNVERIRVSTLKSILQKTCGETNGVSDLSIDQWAY
jgi:hypothetical protein